VQVLSTTVDVASPVQFIEPAYVFITPAAQSNLDEDMVALWVPLTTMQRP
jgi:hypothetical protein